jgi:hypothetical protein
MREMMHSFKCKPCVDCGKTYHPVQMDFDHRPGTVKLFTIGATNSSRSFDAVRAEIAKCDVVCANCHRIRTWNRINPENPISNEDIVRSPQ